MRFIMLAHQRTGTTVFRTLINLHQQVFLYGEALNPDLHKWGWYAYLLERVREDPRALLPTQASSHLLPYLRHLFAEQEQAGKEVVGVDIKVPQIELMQDIYPRVRDSEFGVLHMRRRNTLAAVVSHMTMMDRQRRGAAVHAAQTVENRSIHVDLEVLAFRIPHFELLDQRINRLLRKSQYLEIYYEDFTAPGAWPGICQKLSDFFGVTFDVPFTPKLSKQNVLGLSQLIRNADQVRRRFPKYFEMEQAAAQ